MRRWHRCQLFGRPVKPLAVALAVANATVAVTYLLDGDALGASHWADAVAAAVAAAVSVALLVAGFLDPRDRWTADGMAAAAGVWAYLATLYALTFGPWTPSVWLAVGWTIAAGGACRLELNDRGERGK